MPRGRPPHASEVMLGAVANTTTSVAYAPDEMLVSLAVGGLAGFALAPWAGLAIAVTLSLLVVSLHYARRAGTRDVALITTRLGRPASALAAAALLLDYLLVIAVSVSAAAGFLLAGLPALHGHRLVVALLLLAVLLVGHGVDHRLRRRLLVVGVWAYGSVLALLVLVGGAQWAGGALPPAPSAGLEPAEQALWATGALGGGLLLLRAVAAGSVALAGVETLGSAPRRARPGGQAGPWRAPAAVWGLLSLTGLVGVLVLARVSDVRFVADPARQLLRDGAPVGTGYHQDPVIGQVTQVVFHEVPTLAALAALIIAAVLALAAGSALGRLPVLAADLVDQGWLPRPQRHSTRRLRGDWVAAPLVALLLVGSGAGTARLVPLYLVAVLVLLGLLQAAAQREWSGRLTELREPRARRYAVRARAATSAGLALTFVLLAVVAVSRFLDGVWLVLGVLLLVSVMMGAVNTHYRQSEEALVTTASDAERPVPPRVHSLVLVSRLDRATMRALAYARAARPARLEALCVPGGPAAAEELRRAWQGAALPVPLVELAGATSSAVVEHVERVRQEQPRALLMVYLPQVATARRWQRLLHDRGLARLSRRLARVPRTVVVPVIWQLPEQEAS